MNELSTETNYAVILFFHDESVKFITEEQYRRLLLALENPSIKSINLNGNLYYIGGFRKVLTMDEYYKEYPEKRPVTYNEISRDDNYLSIIDRAPVNGLPSLIEGLKKFLKLNPNSPKAKEQLERLQTKI